MKQTLQTSQPYPPKLVKGESSKGEAVKIQGIGVPLVFGNNFMQCLIMFLPGLGACWGAFVLYNTGMVLAAYGAVAHVDPLLLLVSLFIYPFSWMEYISYSLAVSESLWLVHAAFKRMLRKELAVACKAIVICAVLLLLASHIEVFLISLQA